MTPWRQHLRDDSPSGGLEVDCHDADVLTLIVLVHGFGGSPQKTWGRTPQLLRAESQGRWDVGLFSYKTGLWPLGRQGVRNVAEQLSQSIREAYMNRGYRYVGIAGHSMGCLIASLAAEELLNDEGERAVNVSGLLTVAAAWGPVILAVPLVFHSQLRDLGGFGANARGSATEAFDRVTKNGIWALDVATADDAVTPAGTRRVGTRRAWIRHGHMGAAAASDAADQRYAPFRRLAEATAKGSVLAYLRALRDALPTFGIPRIVGQDDPSGWANDLYEPRTVSEYSTDAQRVDREEREYIFTGEQLANAYGADRHPSDDVTALLSDPEPAAVVTGEGGAGKSTAIVELARIAMNQALEDPRGCLIPVLIRLNEGAVQIPSGRDVLSCLEVLRPLIVARAYVEAALLAEPRPDLIVIVDGLDEANESQLGAVQALADRVVDTGHRLIVAGRPEAVPGSRQFRVFQLDQMPPGRLENIARKQLRDHADEFLEWTDRGGAGGLISNPGQFEMLMRLWWGERDSPTPRTMGDLYRMVLPHVLARRRDPTDAWQTDTPPECYVAARRLEELVCAQAFVEIEGDSADEGRPSLPGALLDIAENGGIVERFRGTSGLGEWRFSSARWREYFSSVELQRRVEVGDDPGQGRASNLNVWRLAGTAGDTGRMVRDAAAAQSPLLELAVATAMQADDHGNLASSLVMGPFGAHAIGILRDTPTPRARTAIADAIKDPKVPNDVREVAVQSLTGTQDRDGLHALVGMLEDPDAPEGVRRDAALSLRGTQDREGLQALVRVLEDPNSPVEVRRAAAWSLRRTQDRDGLQALVRVLNEPATEGGLLVEAAASLQGTEDRVILQALGDSLEDPNTPEIARGAAAWGLEGTMDKAILQTLLGLLEDPETSEELREMTAAGLWGTQDPDILHALIGLLDDPNASEEVRGAAALSLVHTQDREGLQALVHVLEDLNAPEDVRWAAASSLSHTEDRNGLRAVVCVLEDPNSPKSVREVAAWGVRNAPSGWGMVQLLVERTESASDPLLREVILSRLILDDIPFVHWPRSV